MKDRRFKYHRVKAVSGEYFSLLSSIETFQIFPVTVNMRYKPHRRKMMKKMLALLAGVMLFSMTNVSFAEADNFYGITIPYAVHNAQGYWSGLALSNTGPVPLHITVYDVGSGSKRQISSLVLQPYSKKVDMLHGFTGGFASQDGTYSLLFATAKGNDVDDYFKATLYTGNSNGFGFQSFDAEDLD